MAIRNIVQVGDEVLRKKSAPVAAFDEKLHQLLDELKETLKERQRARACRRAGRRAPPPRLSWTSRRDILNLSIP